MNATDLTFSSAYGMDKIVQVFSGSFTATSLEGGIAKTIPVGINDLVFYDGIYSVDGGSNIDLGAETIVNGVEFQILGQSTAGNIKFYANNGDSASHLVAYSVAVIAKPSNTFYTPSNSPNNALYFNTVRNYQKIVLEDSQPVTIAAAGSAPTDTVVPIAHNLGRRPCVRAFVDDGTTLTDVLVRNGVALTFGNTVLMTNTVDNTNVTFRFTNLDATPYSYTLSYRIYYDAN